MGVNSHRVPIKKVKIIQDQDQIVQNTLKILKSIIPAQVMKKMIIWSLKKIMKLMNLMMMKINISLQKRHGSKRRNKLDFF